MKIFLTAVLYLQMLACFCQSSINKQNKNIYKWMKSVVNLECSRPNFSSIELINAIRRAKQFYGAAFTDSIEFAIRDSMNYFKRRDTITGTAILVKEKNKSYLVTAKHVVYDDKATLSNFYNQKARREEDRKYIMKTPFLISDMISVFTPYEKYLSTKTVKKETSLLSYGVSLDSLPYEFSKNVDVAVISLQGESSKELKSIIENNNYTALNISDIDSINELYVSDEIIALGFNSFSRLDTLRFLPNDTREGIIALPVCTFGKIALEHKTLPYFIGDITVYPGNSGGPIFSNGKLIGLVSAQLSLNIQDNNGFAIPYYSRGVLTYCIKSKEILAVIRELQRRGF